MNVLKNRYDDEILCLHKMDHRQHVTWEIEGTCALACRYCYPSRTKTGIMSAKMVDRIIDGLNQSEIECVHLTGGEPTRSPYLEYIIKGLRNKRIYITTNLADDMELIERLIKDYDVYSVAVSLDSIQPDINDKIRGLTERVLHHLERLVSFKKANGIKTKIRLHCVISEYNLNSIPELLQWSKKLGLDEVSCQPVSIEENHKDYQMLHLGESHIDKIAAVFQEEERLFHSDYADSHCKLTLYYLKHKGCIIEDPHDLCSLFIDANGQIWNCPKKIKRVNSLFEKSTGENCKVTFQCMTCLKHLQITER